MFRFKQRCKLVHFILSNVLHIQPVIYSDTALTPIYCKSTPKRSHKTSNIFSSARLVEALPVNLLSLSLALSLSHSLSLSLTSVSTRTVVATTEGPVGPNERWALRGCQPAMASHSQPNLLSTLPSAPVALLCFSNGKRTFLWFWWLIATIWRMYYYFFLFLVHFLIAISYCLFS